jgi:AI-2 transport protein TqsA
LRQLNRLLRARPTVACSATGWNAAVTAPIESRSYLGDPWLRTLVGLIAVIAALGALYVGSFVFAPVACALFVVAVLWPVQSWLQSRLPTLLALAIVMLIAVAGFLLFASLIAWAFSRVGRSLFADADRFRAIYDYGIVWLEGHGIVVAAIWAEHFNVGWLLRTIQGVTGRVNTTITFWLIVFTYVMLGLLEVSDFRRRIGNMKNGEAARVLCDGSRETAAKLRHYLVIRTLMSLATGLLVWALAALAGLQLAAEWGVIAFALNYIPFIGPFIATLFPTLYALAQFASWQTALAVFLALNVIQFVIGSYIEPRVSGKALAISPSVVLFAVFFWTFLWGLFGAFIGVPITIALLVFSAQHSSTRWLAEIFGSAGDPPALVRTEPRP